jgi:hypothetical protein
LGQTQNPQNSTFRLSESKNLSVFGIGEKNPKDKSNSRAGCPGAVWGLSAQLSGGLSVGLLWGAYGDPILINHDPENVVIGPNSKPPKLIIFIARIKKSKCFRFTTFLFSPHVDASHKVSLPEASCLPLLVFPAGHAVHTRLTPFSFASQDVAPHKVSIPEASWSPLLVFPAGHTTHTWFTTFSFVPQDVASHVVSLPEAS